MTMGELQCRWWVFGHVFNAFRKCYRRENVRVISDGCSASAVFRFQAHADSLLQAPALLVCFLLTATENRHIAFETTSLTVLTTSTCNMYTLSEEGRTGRSDSWWTCQTVECLGRLGDILKLHSSGRFRNLYTAFPRRQVHRFQTSENSIDRNFFPWMIPTEVCGVSSQGYAKQCHPGTGPTTVLSCLHLRAGVQRICAAAIRR